MGGTGSCELFCQRRGGDGEGGTKGADTASKLPKCLLLPTEEFQQIFNWAEILDVQFISDMMMETAVMGGKPEVFEEKMTVLLTMI